MLLPMHSMTVIDHDGDMFTCCRDPKLTAFIFDCGIRYCDNNTGSNNSCHYNASRRYL